MKTRRIVKFFDGIQWLFQVQNFSRNLTIQKEDEGKKVAEIIFREDYQEIEIKIYPCFFKENLKEQRKILLHELCHTITIPQYNMLIEFIRGKTITEESADSIHERSTCQIENILDGLLQNRMSYARLAYKEYLKVPKKRKKKKK